jgi:hypothetical protein
MNDTFSLGLFILLATVVGSRWLNQGALARLSDAEKVRVLDAFSGKAKYLPVVLVALLGAHLLAPDWLPTPLYLGCLAAYVVVSLITNFVMLRGQSLPASYLRTYYAGQAAQVVGLGVFFTLLFG